MAVQFSFVFPILDFLILILYHTCAFSFCRSLLGAGKGHRLSFFVSLAVNSLVLAASLILQLPILLCYLLAYLSVFLEFSMSFQGTLPVCLFGAGTFLFHVMDVQMILTSIYVLLFSISSAAEFLPYYSSLLFFTLLLILAFLEVFRRAVNQDTLRLLLENSSQLVFVTTSLTLIDVYLLVLSVSYSSQAYSPMAAVFLLCTGILLFGAFYTSFQHAVRMSVLLRYKNKSLRLEQQLRQNDRDMGALRQAAFTDALTAVHNRRYGMQQLELLIRSKQSGCICFIDIDHLKEVNDQFGHEEGDRYILHTVHALTNTLNRSHILARLGGDEFLLLLPELARPQAHSLLEEARKALEESSSQYQASISYGILEVGPHSLLSASEALRQADQLMYEYKVSCREPGRP